MCVPQARCSCRDWLHSLSPPACYQLLRPAVCSALQGADASHYGGTAYYGLVGGGGAGMAPPGALKAVHPDAPASQTASDSDELERLKAQVAALAARLDTFPKGADTA